MTTLAEILAGLAPQESGVGWRGTGKPAGSGLGTRIIQAVAASLQSKVDYDPTSRGTRASLRFSLV